MMKLVRSIAFSLSVASVSVFAVACGGTVEHSPQTSASAVTKAPVGESTHGVVRLVGEALGDVGLRADQRAEIEKLAADAEARHAPMGEVRKDLMVAFADQIEKGSIDRAALQPKIDKVTVDFEKARTDDRAALVRLHDLLDAEQRNAFVDALETRLKAKHGEFGKHGEHPGRGLGHLKQLADELKLTDAQKTQIHDLMRDAHKEGAAAWKNHGRGEGGHEGWKRHHGGKKALEAFREDKLDLDKVAPPRDVKGMAAFGTERVASFAEKVLPILTPEQRKIAADKVRALAASGDASLLGH